jgi:hypothetical protein
VLPSNGASKRDTHARPARARRHGSRAVDFEENGRCATQIEFAPPRLTRPDARRVRGQNCTFALLETGENRCRRQLVAAFACDIDRDQMRAARVDTQGGRGPQGAQTEGLSLEASDFEHRGLVPGQR